MNELKVAVLGIGHPRYGVSVLASLATYFGERPLDIRLYDSDPEFLDLFERFGRLLFRTARNPQPLVAANDPVEALADADRVILSMSLRSSALFTKDRENAVQGTVDTLLRGVPKEAKVLSLQPEELDYGLGVYRFESWVPEPSDEERQGLLHQINRYLLGDEPLFEVMKAVERSPLKDWLDNPLSTSFQSKTARL